eukprot:382618-Rhodomonas_salina.2
MRSPFGNDDPTPSLSMLAEKPWRPCPCEFSELSTAVTMPLGRLYTLTSPFLAARKKEARGINEKLNLDDH